MFHLQLKNIFGANSNKKTHFMKSKDNIYFLFILSSFISKTFGEILERKFVNKDVPKCLL